MTKVYIFVLSMCLWIVSIKRSLDTLKKEETKLKVLILFTLKTVFIYKHKENNKEKENRMIKLA